jgi:hypothetical protein
VRARTTRIELATPLGVGAFLGLSAGVVLGIMAGPIGAILAVAGGTVAGLVAGLAMHRDDSRRAARSRELDDIIGVTEGNLGAAPVSMPPPRDDTAANAWMAEWLTPPPPVAG